MASNYTRATEDADWVREQKCFFSLFAQTNDITDYTEVTPSMFDVYIDNEIVLLKIKNDELAEADKVTRDNYVPPVIT